MQRDVVKLGAGVRDYASAPARAKANGGTAPASTPDAWPDPLNLELLADREPERPQFIIQDWWPVSYATLLAGHGGVGKSGIALHLAMCTAAGEPFFGLEVARRRVLYLSCEDRESVLHWRLARIAEHSSIDLAGLRDWLHVVDLVGRDSILWERDPRTGSTMAPAYTHLAELIRRAEIQVLIVDGVSDTYAGDENRRSDVKRYVNALMALIPADGAVLLVGHIAKPSTTDSATREGYSGSTAWHNSVRARWYLYPETQQGEEGGRPERTGELLLELQKSNLGRIDQAMRFRWDADAHLFVGQASGASAFDRKHQDREERAGILAAMRAVIAAGDYIPAAMTGPRTALHVLTVRPEMPESLRSGKPAKRRFWRLIEEMRAMRTVTEQHIPRPGDPGHKVKVLTVAEGNGDSGNA